MWLLPVGLLLGISLGFLTNLHIPENYSGYVMVAVLAAFDTLFGGIRALLNNEFENRVFLTGFFFSLAAAAGLTFLGLQLGVDLYLAAVFVFGVRLFKNLAAIRKTLEARRTAHKSNEN